MKIYPRFTKSGILKKNGWIFNVGDKVFHKIFEKEGVITKVRKAGKKYKYTVEFSKDEGDWVETDKDSIELVKNNIQKIKPPFEEREVISFGLGGVIETGESGGVTKITWEDIPDFDKFATNNKVVKWEAKPTDKGLAKIMKNFVANDEDRPILGGVYFDDDYIVSTDAHKLIAIYSKNKKEYIDNTYELASNVKIEGKYPYYINVIPEYFTKEFVVDTDKFKMYVDILFRTKVGDTSTELAVFNIGDEKVGLKLSFLSDVLGAIQQLGYKQFLFRYIDSLHAILFIPDISFKGNDRIKGETTILLLMPMRIGEYSDYKYSVLDLDFERYIDSSYNFKKNVIESGGKEYDLDPYEKSNDDDIFSFREYNYLKNFAHKDKNRLNILQKAFVKDNKFTVTNFTTTITKKVKGLETGIYDLAGMMVYKGTDEMEDYPEIDFGEFSDFANIPIDEMTFNLKYAIPCMSKDEISLKLNGIYFECNNDELIIVSTDAKSMFYNKFNHAEILTESDKKFIVPRETIEVLNRIIKFTDGDNINLSVYENYIKFIIGDYTIIGHLIDEPFIDFRAVLPSYINENGYKITEITTGEKKNSNLKIEETEKTETPTSIFGLYVAAFNEQEHKDLFAIFGKNKKLKAYHETERLHYITPIDKTQTIDEDVIAKKKERRKKVSISRKKEEKKKAPKKENGDKEIIEAFKAKIKAAERSLKFTSGEKKENTLKKIRGYKRFLKMKNQ